MEENSKNNSIKKPNKSLFTIGHSTHTLEEFLYLLKVHKVNCVVDVRSVPYSQYIPLYNKENIAFELKSAGIQYVYMGKEFGARRDNNELYDENRQLDFEKTVNDSDFKHGVERIKKGLDKGYHIAFMCTEKDPIDCHRCILVGKAFHDLGYDVNNILETGEIISQEQIGFRLLDKYLPDRKQISMFDRNPEGETVEQNLKEVYRKRAQEIAYIKPLEENQ